MPYSNIIECMYERFIHNSLIQFEVLVGIPGHSQLPEVANSMARYLVFPKVSHFDWKQVWRHPLKTCFLAA